MSGRHSDQKKEMLAQQALHTRGRGSCPKRQRYRSSSRDRYERSPDRSDYHSKKESKERDHHHDRDYSRRTKRSRRSYSPEDGKDGKDGKENETSDAEEEQLKTESAVGAYYKLDTDEPFDRDSCQREWQEKGKGSPPAKSTKSMSYFANDGSFLDIFKKMQEEKKHEASIPQESAPSGSAVAPYIVAAAVGAPAPPPICVGRRRGVKILKTGRVPKLRDTTKKSVDPKDFWSVYLAEVDKYNTTGCETEKGHSKLVK